MPRDPGRAYLAHYREHGFAVIRGVFEPREMTALARAFDRIHTEGVKHARSFRHQNVFYCVEQDNGQGPVVRFVQWPSYFDEVLDRFRLDRRLFDIVEPLLGPDLKQIINQLNWKPRGEAMGEFCFHQDIHFRRPASAYRNPASSYVQTAIAVDSHRPENGAIRVHPGSHKLGALTFPVSERVMHRSLQDEDIRAVGLDPANLVDLVLDPGDVAIWNLFTVHGSGPNGSKGDRRVYINGFVRAEDCDRGEWAYRDGRACPLGEPALVHFEDLYRRPEPHYVDG